jgi:acetyl esterase/lipase
MPLILQWLFGADESKRKRRGSRGRGEFAEEGQGRCGRPHDMLARMRFRVLLAVVLLCSVAHAQEKSEVGTAVPKDSVSTEILWPVGAPGAVGTTFDDVPKLWCYPAPGPGPHTAVVVLPGGGYTHLVTGAEGVLEAHWLNSKGISAYVLQYRLGPRYLYPAAMLDGQRAVRVVRAHAKEWQIKPDAIGVWGFSAGGHLAGYLATADPHALVSLHPLDTIQIAVQRSEMMPTTDAIDKLSAHPDFAILNYARLTIDKNIPGTFGMETLTGPNASAELIDAISPVKHVTKETSPSFIYATEYDEKVNSLNATAFYDALQRAHVSAELHIFERGPHGTHMGTDKPDFPELAVYPVLLENWLRVHGWVK